MYEKVLFPTDFSKYTRKTLECIGDIPGIKDIVLLHVVDATHYSIHGWEHEKHIEDAKIRLEEQKQHLENIGLKAKTNVKVVTEGDVADEILRTANNEDVSLIVMNAKGKSLIEGLLLGSTSLNVMRHAKIDVLLMRYKLVEDLEGQKFEKFCPRILSKVLCPTDFTENDEITLSFVKDMGIHEMILTYVVTKGETKEEIDKNIEIAKNLLEDTKNKYKDLNIKAHIRVGNPAEEICSVAEDEDVSLIAMSSHGKNWLKEMLLGDTTYNVVKNAKRPVLILRNK